jgi:N-methylhydantoinase A
LTTNESKLTRPRNDPENPAPSGVHIGVDVGGTFTDLTAHVPGRDAPLQFKLPSTPHAPERAILDGIKTVLREHNIAPTSVARVSHGTTVGTNALIQRKVGTVGIVTSRGFRDLLEIARQTRPRVYDLHLDHPAPLVPRERRFEVPERTLADGTIHCPLDLKALDEVALALSAAKVDSVVVCFINAYAYPEHERQAAERLRTALGPDVHVLTSTGVFPEFREYERFSTAVLNAALITVMNDYLNRFEVGIAELGIPARPEVSQSVGGLMSLAMARDLPLRASLSGPAAGVIGAGARGKAGKFGDIITLDMGGTSADVSLMVDAQATEVHDRTLAGFALRMPALDVNAVGAGGGSVAWIDRDGLLKVGPQSAGATPGPACYGLGGTAATVTDANVTLGRLNQDALLDGTMPIKPALARKAVGELAHALGLGLEQTALGIVQVTAAVMVKAVRAISVERGHDPTRFALFAFGGAGPLHAVEVARELDIATVVVPPGPGLLCAQGLLHCDLRADFVTTVLRPLNAQGLLTLESARALLGEQCQSWFEREAVPLPDRSVTWLIDLRYVGQNFELTINLSDLQPHAHDDTSFGQSFGDELTAAFHRAHDSAYGFASDNEPIELVNLRARTIGRLDKPPLARGHVGPVSKSVTERDAIFAANGSHIVCKTPVFRRDDLAIDQQIVGPAIIEQLDTTTVIHPADVAQVDQWGNLLITLGANHER